VYLDKAQSVADLRRIARGRLPRAVFDFFDGGAEDELAWRANSDAFSHRPLRPRVLRDVSSPDPAVSLLGTPSALPLAIAPMGAIGLGWRGADTILARTAAAAGIPYTLSSAAHSTIEDVARAADGGRLWFQPYMLSQRDFVQGLIARAEAAGYEALVVTVDLPLGGKRERDRRNDFALPFRLTLRNFIDFATHPRWSLEMLIRGQPVMGNMQGLGDSAAATTTRMASTVGRSMDAGFDLEALRRVRDRWPRRFIVKGVLHPEDADALVAMGCDAIVVSNHGGRQFDAAPATLDALPDVVAAVGGRAQVLLDGGIRRGRHIVQAMALGADAVLVGRAALFGVAAGGEAGARLALDILRDEFVRTMQLCGARRAGEIDAGLLLRPSSHDPRRGRS
jgi:(S)-mandelate dehydrogenase